MDRQALRKYMAHEDEKDRLTVDICRKLKGCGYPKVAHAIRTFGLTHVSEVSFPVLRETEALIELLTDNHEL